MFHLLSGSLIGFHALEVVIQEDCKLQSRIVTGIFRFSII